MDFKSLKTAEKAALIAFAVDNNPREVGYQMQQRGYNLTGVDISQYKTILMYADKTGHDVSWVMDIPYIDSAQNWTTKLVQDNKPADGVAARGISWSDVGNIALNVGLPILTTILAGSLGKGNNTPAPPPARVEDSEKIMGMDKSLFYVLMAILIIVIMLGVFVAVRR